MTDKPLREPDAEAVAREKVWGRVRELQRNPHWSVAINRVDAALDAYREAVERRVRAEMAQQATDAIARLSSVPMRSLSPEEMAVLMFANKAIAAVGHLAHNQQDTP